MKNANRFLLVMVVCLWGLHAAPRLAESASIGDIAIHGFISQGYADSSGNHEHIANGFSEGTFEFNEMGINFSAEPTGNLRVGMQFFGYDLGEVGNDEVILDWAYADYRLEDYFGIRAGLLKIPHGLYNETRDIDMLRTSIFLPISLYGELWRDAFSRLKGVGVYGSLPGGMSYQAVIGGQSMNVKGGFTKAFEAQLDMHGETWDGDYAFALNLLWNTPLRGLKLGVSHYSVRGSELQGVTGDRVWPLMALLRLAQGETSTLVPLQNLSVLLDFERISASAASIEYSMEKLTLVAEYVQYPLGIDLISRDSGETAGQTLYRLSAVMEGYYGGASYRFFSWLELGAYYTELYFDKDDRHGGKFKLHPRVRPDDTYSKDLCLSLRFDLNDNWLLKLEGHRIKGTGGIVNYGEVYSNHYEFYAAKITYNF